MDCGEARGNFRGVFSLVLWEYWDRTALCHRAHPYRPRVLVKHIDSKRSLMSFGSSADVDKQDLLNQRRLFRGRFLDLRTLAFALTNEAHSLESAYKAFGVGHGKLAAKLHGEISSKYIYYNRRDVLATRELLEKAKSRVRPPSNRARPL